MTVSIKAADFEPLYAIVDTIAGKARLDLPEALASAAREIDARPQHRREAVADLLHAAIDLGLLSEFLDAATAYATTKTRPWPGSGYERAADDPHLIARFGRFVAALEALRALVEEAVGEVAEESDHAGRAAFVARRYAIDVGAAFVSSTIELLGASATSIKHGFDERWRAVLDHARLHRPRGQWAPSDRPAQPSQEQF
jgi:alkylation response protein AidB-like acyl-CoA dehydrogenase